MQTLIVSRSLEERKQLLLKVEGLRALDKAYQLEGQAPQVFYEKYIKPYREVSLWLALWRWLWRPSRSEADGEQSQQKETLWLCYQYLLAIDRHIEEIQIMKKQARFIQSLGFGTEENTSYQFSKEFFSKKRRWLRLFGRSGVVIWKDPIEAYIRRCEEQDGSHLSAFVDKMVPRSVSTMDRNRYLVEAERLYAQSWQKIKKKIERALTEIKNEKDRETFCRRCTGYIESWERSWTSWIDYFQNKLEAKMEEGQVIEPPLQAFSGPSLDQLKLEGIQLYQKHIQALGSIESEAAKQASSDRENEEVKKDLLESSWQELENKALTLYQAKVERLRRVFVHRNTSPAQVYEEIECCSRQLVQEIEAYAKRLNLLFHSDRYGGLSSPLGLWVDEKSKALRQLCEKYVQQLQAYDPTQDPEVIAHLSKFAKLRWSYLEDKVELCRDIQSLVKADRIYGEHLQRRVDELKEGIQQKDAILRQQEETLRQQEETLLQQKEKRQQLKEKLKEEMLALRALFRFLCKKLPEQLGLSAQEREEFLDQLDQLGLSPQGLKELDDQLQSDRDKDSETQQTGVIIDQLREERKQLKEGLKIVAHWFCVKKGFSPEEQDIINAVFEGDTSAIDTSANAQEKELAAVMQAAARGFFARKEYARQQKGKQVVEEPEVCEVLKAPAPSAIH